MKYRDLFELENALKTGMSSTKYWTLLKPLTKISSKVRRITDSVREQLEPTEAIKLFNSELNRLKTNMRGKDKEDMDKAVNDLVLKHHQAQIDALEKSELEREILDDAVEVELKQIPESYLHLNDELRISTELYTILDRLDLVEHEEIKPSLKAVEGDKK